ncbi:enolase C-terminal domain-like protein [Bradyrhizobium sp. SHOUNA76]|uniref:enolase C-terminal domain-like protein n=1 Tax=Bradyrhizobium sp. SHOUNA76 TaxID=2908927 RepID=UPI0038571FCB
MPSREAGHGSWHSPAAVVPAQFRAQSRDRPCACRHRRRTALWKLLGGAIAQALELAPQLDRFGLAWLEEPIRADRPRQEWTQLREAIRFPLAAGENIASHAGFAEVLREPVLDVVQPDIAKWGGLSACASIARDILRRERSSARIISAPVGRAERGAFGASQPRT